MRVGIITWCSEMFTLFEENKKVVEQLILSQEDQPGTHYSKRDIFDLTGISKSSVDRISNKNLDLKGFRKIKGEKMNKVDRETRVVRCKKMLRRLTKAKLTQTFFTAEKQGSSTTQYPKQPCLWKKKQISDKRLYVERRAFAKIFYDFGRSLDAWENFIHFVEPKVQMNGDHL